jgi:hypothetical protein
VQLPSVSLTPKINVNYITKIFQSSEPLLGSGFQWQTFTFIWIPELPLASDSSFSLLTAATQN